VVLCPRVACSQVYIESYANVPPPCKRTVATMAYMFMFSWGSFPLLFLLGPEGFNHISPSASNILHGVADLFAKNLWGVYGTSGAPFRSLFVATSRVAHLGAARGYIGRQVVPTYPVSVPTCTGGGCRGIQFQGWRRLPIENAVLWSSGVQGVHVHSWSGVFAPAPRALRCR